MFIKKQIFNEHNSLFNTNAIEMSVKERIIEFIKYLNISVRQFERECGLSYGYVSNMRVSIQPDKLMNISKQFPQLNTGWLMTGEGDMLKHIEESKTIEPQPGEQMKFDFSTLIRASEKTAEAVQTIANSNEKMAESNRLLAETNAEMWQTIKGKLDRIEELLEKKGGNVQGIPRVV